MRAENLANDESSQFDLETKQPLSSTDVWGRPITLIARSEPKRVERGPQQEEVYACFRTEERFFCREDTCKWRKECTRLVAAWRN